MATYSFPQAGQTVSINENGGLQNIGAELDFTLFAPSASGMMLTISGLLATDRLWFGAATGFGFANGVLTLDGATIGVATGGAGTDLVIAFVGGVQPEDVATVIHQLVFGTTSNTPQALRTLSWAFTGVDGTPLGNIAAPSFAEVTSTANPLNGLAINDSAGMRTDIAFADIDGDGDRDFYSFAAGGNDVDFWRNDAGHYSLIENSHAFAGGLRSPGTFFDLDGDGDLDFIGVGTGLTYELNTGTASTPVFPSATADLIPLAGAVAVAAGDLDGDGDTDLVYSLVSGGLRYARNDGPSNTTVRDYTVITDGPWTAVGSGQSRRPALGDVDGDGDLDMVLVQTNSAQTAASLRYFRNDGTKFAPSLVEISGSADPFASLTLPKGASIALEDVDGDNDLDLIVTTTDGDIRTFLNTTSIVSPTLNVGVVAQNDAPVITSNGGKALAVTINENQTAVTTVVASDPESAVSYSLTGVDAALFSIGAGGALKFRAAPDFETPKGHDKLYAVTVIASDGSLSDTQNISVTVRNVAGNSIAGTSAADRVDASNTIGGKGATGEEDRINGKVGDDTIRGEGGDDTLIGGAGKDQLWGGTGKDAFVFNAAPSASNLDTIRDFQHDVDVIQLDDAIFLAVGTSLTSAEFYVNAGAKAAHDPSDRIIYDSSSGKLYYDADGNRSGAAAIHFATLSSKPVLDHGDFAIV